MIYMHSVETRSAVCLVQSLQHETGLSKTFASLHRMMRLPILRAMDSIFRGSARTSTCSLLHRSVVPGMLPAHKRRAILLRAIHQLSAS